MVKETYKGKEKEIRMLLLRMQIKAHKKIKCQDTVSQALIFINGLF